MFHCLIDERDIPDDEAVHPSTGGVPDLSTWVHLVDSGPGHADLTTHVLERGAKYGALYSPPIPVPAEIDPGDYRRMQALFGAASPDLQFLADTSHYQHGVDDSYHRPAFAHKVSQGTSYVDSKADHNGSWGADNSGSKGRKMVCHIGYHVWYPGNEDAQTQRFLTKAHVDSRFVAMLDIESWGGAIKGDHSSQINKMANNLAAELGRERVIVYYNAGDGHNIYPGHPDWVKITGARYSANPPAFPHSLWQYSDGEAKYPVPSGYPRISAPFGRCDHNVFIGSRDKFQSIFGFGSGPAPTPAPKPAPVPVKPPAPLPIEEEVMSFYKDKADYEQSMKRIASEAADSAVALHEKRFWADPLGRFHRLTTFVARVGWSTPQWKAANDAADKAAAAK